MNNSDRRGLFLFNGAPGQGSLRIAGTQIAALSAAWRPGDVCLDLRGDRLLPGLINAHDHLQLNALPRLKYQDRYSRVSQWIADIDRHRASDPLLLANAAVPREQRLLIGGLKNLLSGVTTVAHHDPDYPALSDPGFPVRVLQGHGWSHSLGLDGPQALQQAQRRTPADKPWIVHAAEGCDAVAAAEFDQLEALGCIAANTVLVHGVALSTAQQRRLARAGAGLVWCPASNLHLFGRTPDVSWLFEQGRLALGSDSRISGGRDLLAELRVARQHARLDDAALELLVTERAAQLLRLPDRGRLQRGALADLIVLPAGLPLSQASRTDIQLVLIGGQARLAAPHYAEALGPAADLLPVELDGQPRYLARALVQALRTASLQEPGLTIKNTELAETA